MATMYEKVTEALKNYTWDKEICNINDLIAYAYYLGRHDAAKEACDDAKKIFKEQKARAAECRYHKMASAVLGDSDFIYHQDYDSWIYDFSRDIVEV